MSVINFGSTVSLKEFEEAIAAVGGDVTIIGQGEMGIGKSSVLYALGGRMPEHALSYIDCTLLDLGDIALPYTDVINGTKVTKFAPNARFRMHEGKPVIIMLDEIGKALRSVKNVLLTLMLEHRIGDHYLPAGSIVFGTTNLITDGVGDMLEAHARNRVALVTVRKPNADEWIAWAMNNDIDPTVITWVKQYPHALASYTDGAQEDNPYIFIPAKAGQSAVVTPRSLEKASHIVKKRRELGDSLTVALLAGAIGESAARDMQAFLSIADELPSWESIIERPDNVRVPEDTIARCLLVFSAVTRVTKESLTPWMAYVQRFESEWQALFATSVMKSKEKQPFCSLDKTFQMWALENSWLF